MRVQQFDVARLAARTLFFTVCNTNERDASPPAFNQLLFTLFNDTCMQYSACRRCAATFEATDEILK